MIIVIKHNNNLDYDKNNIEICSFVLF